MCLYSATNGNKTACDCYTNGASICNNYYTNTGCANDAYAQGVIADLAVSHYAEKGIVKLIALTTNSLSTVAYLLDLSPFVHTFLP